MTVFSVTDHDLRVSDVAPHSLPVAEGKALSLAHPSTTWQANRLQALNGVLRQGPEQEKAKTLTVQRVIFNSYSYLYSY